VTLLDCCCEQMGSDKNLEKSRFVLATDRTSDIVRARFPIGARADARNICVFLRVSRNYGWTGYPLAWPGTLTEKYYGTNVVPNDTSGTVHAVQIYAFRYWIASLVRE
jgi:hypothetical protein